MDELAGASRRFMARGLDERDVADDPVTQFERWHLEVTQAGLVEPDAMVVATATPDGVPSARFVLLRGIDERGFRFFTNGGSQKAEELDANPRAALVFAWHAVSRQVRVSGPATRLPAAEADAYFAERPRGSQIASVASDQSRPIADRAALDERYREVDARFAGRQIGRPDSWTGYVVRPEVVEFWQGREFRFHDRVRYSADGATWSIERLQP
jgi:pyridoxamine 5'-phosphate oxidase